MPFLLSFCQQEEILTLDCLVHQLSWMFKEIFFTVVWDVFTFWVAKKILRHFVNQSEITLKQKATYLQVRLRCSNSQRTRMEILAKRRSTLFIFPHLAGTPTSYVFSELLLVHRTVCACCDWLGKRPHHFFNQSELKPKPMVICWHAFSGAWCQVHIFSLSPD